MARWLAMPILLAFSTAVSGQAQIHAVPQRPAAGHLQSLDFSIAGKQDYEAPGPLRNGMITEQEVSADSFFGVGLVKMRGRKKDGSDMRPGADPVSTRNPAVTFVVRF